LSDLVFRTKVSLKIEIEQLIIKAQPQMLAKKYNILLVEDDEVDIMNIQRAFRKKGLEYPLHIAHNGIEALQMLREDEDDELAPCIVLMDINMPMMGGLECLEAIRSDPKLKSLSVYIMTTSNEDSDKKTAFSLNAAGYILKPIFTENFLSAISTLDSYWQLCEMPPQA
jgi:CheY-like chemotaxis protein